MVMKCGRPKRRCVLAEADGFVSVGCWLAMPSLLVEAATRGRMVAASH